MDILLSLERLYVNVSQAVIGTDGDSILFANPSACAVFGSDITARPAAEVIPGDILDHDADSFVCACEILGREAGISVIMESGVRILIIDLVRGEASPLKLSRSIVIGMRSSAMGMKLAADKCFEHMESGSVPDGKVVSTFYHYYYTMLRAITQMDSADQLERGDLCFSPEVTELVPLCSELVDTVSLLCRESGVALTFATEEDSVITMADPQKLEQLLLNLLANSLRHTSKGGSISVSLSVMGGRAVISVDDNGSGLPKDVKVFSLPDDNARPDSGYGLGLYIAYGIAHLHGGTILIEGGSGGTHARVSFPIVSPPGNILRSCEAAYKAKGASLVLTELADVLDTKCYGPIYED